jgi:hypothetical protein
MILLRISTLIDARGIVDLEPITKPSTGDLSSIKDEMVGVLRQLKWRLEPSQWEEFHLTTKAGPNGPALLSSMIDLHLLPERLTRSIKVMGGDALSQIMDTLTSAVNPDLWTKHFKMKPKGIIRKLSIVHDPEAKERVIAMLDYWSQTALKPLHDSEFSLLRAIQGDCTFNQSDFTRWIRDAKTFHSVDLTSATDRFPIALQKVMLSELIGTDKAEAWEDIMVGYDFNFQGKNVRYACGQPMGAYSSWPTFALNHHLIVRMAAKRAGFPVTFNCYSLLGDDIVIGDSQVAYEYKKLISTLGVDISEQKTHESSHTFSFAKRWIHKGVEITGIRLDGWINNQKYYLLAEELRQAYSRYLPDSDVVAIPGLESLLRILNIRVNVLKMRRNLEMLDLTSSRVQVGDDQLRRVIARYWGSYLGCSRSKDFYRAFVLQTLAEVKTHFIEERLKENAKKAQPFMRKVGLLAQSLGLDDQSILRSLPPVQVAISHLQRIQDDFDRLRSAYYDDDAAIIAGSIIRSGLDPERVLSSRSSHLVLQANSTLVFYYNSWAKAYRLSRDEELCQGSQSDDDQASQELLPD